MSNADAIALVNDAESGKRMVFISYTSKYRPFAWRLAKDLRTESQDVWIDHIKLRGGELWEEEIEKAIQAATTVCVVLPEAEKEPNWVKKEYTKANYYGKRPIPIKFRSCEIPLRLSDYQAFDCTSPAKYENEIPRIRELTGQDPTPIKVSPLTRLLVWHHKLVTIAPWLVSAALVVWLCWWFLPPSKTIPTVLYGEAKSGVVVQLENSGGRPATIRGYRLKFGGLPIIDGNLDVADVPPISEVPRHHAVIVHLKKRTYFDSIEEKDGSHRTAAQIEPLVDSHTITMEVDIKESSDPVPGREYHVRKTTFPARQIWPFLSSALPNMILGAVHAQ